MIPRLLVIDPSTPENRRPWSLMLSEYVTQYDSVEAALRDKKLVDGDSCIVVFHVSRREVQEFHKAAPSNWVGVAVSAGGYSPAQAAGYETARCYFRRLPVQSGTEVDPGFQACWKRFIESLDFGRPDFSPLDPRGVPDLLLAWVLGKKVSHVLDVPEIDDAALREAYNQLLDGIPADDRVDLIRLDANDSPSVEQAVSLIRAARI